LPKLRRALRLIRGVRCYGIRHFSHADSSIEALSFGGPAGQIALMHRVLVDERRWISEDRFLHGLNFCMLLPDQRA
jgi:hypothetical protein